MADNKEVMANIYGEEEIEEFETEVEGGNKVQSIEDATRFAYGLTQTREEVEKYESIATTEIDKWQGKIAQVQEWLATVTDPLKSKEEYLASQLLFFHTTQYNSAANEKEQKKLNSIKLPYGITLKSRALADKLEVGNDKEYLQYAEENKLLKTVEPTVDWAAMKKNIIVNSEGKALNKETGEFMDFIKVVPQERKFEVK